MFGWLRSLTKRATIDDQRGLVLDAAAAPEPPHDFPDPRATVADAAPYADRPTATRAAANYHGGHQTAVEAPTDPVPATFHGRAARHDDESQPLRPEGDSPIRAAAAAAAQFHAQQRPTAALEADAEAAAAAPIEVARAEFSAGPELDDGAMPVELESTASHDAEPAARTDDAAPADEARAPEPAAEAADDARPTEPAHPEFAGIVPAPSQRPAMPLSAHPNFAGLDLAVWEPSAPRLLQPEAALTPEAQTELLKLFDDLFGPAGRYRLEWRTDRRVGDDAMFAEIMTADLVRRVQNTIADVAELERIEPPKRLTERRAITAKPYRALEPRDRAVDREPGGKRDGGASKLPKAS